MKMTFEIIIAFIALAWIFLYTTSYGVWVWKKKNILGAIAVFLVAVAALVFPVYFIIATR
ncbi:MAG TPA: hypothetical protein GXX14_11930 [Clostridiaceae bacterium]|nr:hypothetical protein [Clostridiaceae bacterium]